jgi:hypothetical protein
VPRTGLSPHTKRLYPKPAPDIPESWCGEYRLRLAANFHVLAREYGRRNESSNALRCLRAAATVHAEFNRTEKGLLREICELALALGRADCAVPAGLGMCALTEPDDVVLMADNGRMLGLALLQAGRPKEARPHLEKGWRLMGERDARRGVTTSTAAELAASLSTCAGGRWRM